ncbi:MAG: PorV/PorQ family protein [Rhodothermales bacterium]
MNATRLLSLGLFVFMCAAPGMVRAQTEPGGETITKAGTTSAQFLKLGVGARPIALGGAFVAEASDLASVYWNPAGLGRMRGSGVQLSQTRYLQDVSYNFAAVGVSLGTAGAVAASLIFLDSGEMPVRTIDQPDGTGEQFRVQNFALQVSYGRALTDRFSIGGSMKFVQEQIWHSNASSVAFDIGTLYTTPYPRLRLGASFSNFGPKMRMSGRDIMFSYDPAPRQDGNVEIVNSEYETEQHPLPLLFRVGLSWDAVDTPDHRILMSTDAAHPNDNSQYVNMGAEYSFRQLIALRVGYRNLFEVDGEQGLTFGGGLDVRMDRTFRARIDYAYADFGRLEETHWVTLNLAF